VTPQAFREWLIEMQNCGLARSDAECARLLGVHINSIVKRKRDGADQETALACRALLHRLDPFDINQQGKPK
jgi:hypothetical protein